MKINKSKLMILSLTAVVGMVITQACKKSFLDAQPYGQYGLEQVKNKEGLKRILIGVYGVIDGQNISGDGWEGS